jgi:catechol 2,3-dioxygenase-like lactoylglutathione lyase family enzyme
MSQQRSESNVQQAVPLLNVSNIQESLRFYIDGLGFEITHKWEPDGRLRWCWLQHGSAALMVQELPKDGPDSWSPEGRVGEGVAICFMCKDAIAIYRQMLDRNFKVSKPFVGNRLWVTSLSDPDGYRIDFESPTDLPEDTEYSEPVHKNSDSATTDI